MSLKEYIELSNKLTECKNAHLFTLDNLLIEPGSANKGYMNIHYTDPATVNEANIRGKRVTIKVTEQEARFLIECFHFYWSMK